MSARRSAVLVGLVLLAAGACSGAGAAPPVDAGPAVPVTSVGADPATAPDLTPAGEGSDDPTATTSPPASAVSAPASSTPTTRPAPGSTVVAGLTAEVGGSSIGPPASPIGVYAVVLHNPTSEPTSNIDITITLTSDTGAVVGTADEQVDVIQAGATRAVAGTTTLTGPATHVSARYSGQTGLAFGLAPSDLPTGAFTFSDATQTGDAHDTGVAAQLHSSFSRPFDRISVVAVFRDASGELVGGADETVAIDAQGAASTHPTTNVVIPGISSYELFASYDVTELTD